jgi:hypothetical protein
MKKGDNFYFASQQNKNMKMKALFDSGDKTWLKTFELQFWTKIPSKKEKDTKRTVFQRKHNVTWIQEVSLY